MTSNYTYDALYELTQVTQGANTTESYAYDPVGNRLSSLGVSPYVNNTSNELTSTPNASYTYDYNGNTTGKTDSTGTTSYTWDYENRLASVTLPGTSGSLNFKYDPFGRRVQKLFTQNSTTTTTNYLYDGSNAVEDLDQSGSLIARYAQTQNIDEPLAEQRSGTTSYYEADGLGSVTSLTSSAGAIANTYTYDSFGKLTASTGSISNRFQYTTREFDSESGLYYYRARYYDPTAGRFVREDPAEWHEGLNFYTYVGNSPIGFTDPTGLCPWQVHSRPLNGVPGAKAAGVDHIYFYNTQTGQALGLGPIHNTLKGPVPGKWEPNEGPGKKEIEVPDPLCNCVDKKVKHPGNPPDYCTLKGKKDVKATCMNCLGWASDVLQNCYNEVYYPGQQ